MKKLLILLLICTITQSILPAYTCTGGKKHNNQATKDMTTYFYETREEAEKYCTGEITYSEDSENPDTKKTQAD